MIYRGYAFEMAPDEEHGFVDGLITAGANGLLPVAS